MGGIEAHMRAIYREGPLIDHVGQVCTRIGDGFLLRTQVPTN